MSASQVFGQSVFRGLPASMWVELAIQGMDALLSPGIPSPVGDACKPLGVLRGPRSVSAHRLETGQPTPGGRSAEGGKRMSCVGGRMLGLGAGVANFLTS